MRPHYKDVLERNMWALVEITDFKLLKHVLGEEEGALTERAMRNTYFEWAESNIEIEHGRNTDDGTTIKSTLHGCGLINTGKNQKRGEHETD